MPDYEPVNAETLKKYTFFDNWVKELKRSPDDVWDFAVRASLIEVPSDGPFKKYEPTGKHIAQIIFKNGDYFERPVKLTKEALPEEENDESAKSSA